MCHWHTSITSLLITLLFVLQASAQVEPPPSNLSDPIDVWAERGNRWIDGDKEVWHLRGGVYIKQGRTIARSHEAVLWIHRVDPWSKEPNHVTCYLEGNGPNGQIRIDFGGDHSTNSSIIDHWWQGRWQSAAGIRTNVSHVDGPRSAKPKIVARAERVVRPTPSSVRPVQFTAPQISAPPVAPEAIPLPAARPSRGPRRILITPRGGSRFQYQTRFDPDRNEQIQLIDRGVKVVVEGVQPAQQLRQLGDLERIVLEADRIVIWTSKLSDSDFTTEAIQSGDTPLEFYMEGNIVFAQGDRVIYAERMYYDVNRRKGTILQAEVLTPAFKDYEGLVRLKADVLQQIDEQNFIAYGGAITSSRLGFPRYWFQSDTIAFQDFQTPKIDPLTGVQAFDQQTGELQVEHNMTATSRNNFFYVAGVPISYFPVLATDLEDPVFYIDRIKLGSDSIFGTQVLTDYNAYQLLGIRNKPEGTKWNVTTDGLSERGNFLSDVSGLGIGTDVEYSRENFFGIAGPTKGFFDSWGIKDRGRDNLGRDRRAIVPEDVYRGRLLWQHQQKLDIGFQVTAEASWITDRTFLEQYFEREFDQDKDQTTGIEIKKQWAENSVALSVDYRVNDFYTQTGWLPRLDQFLLGKSLLSDRLTWYAHSHVGYGRFDVADTPTNATLAGQFQRLPWETFNGLPANRSGVRVGTRQELDVPFDLGVFRFVPYVLGDVTHWQEDLSASDRTRGYGQAGIRASVPMWRADPSVQSQLFNLNGLAHKVVFDAEFLWADADENIDRFPLYDPLDDDAQEFFRRRFFMPGATFAGLPGAPLAFDERLYALRTGMQSYVTGASTEIADDLMLTRLGVRQRWQTKRGLPGQERIVDWITFDIEGTFFPKASRDNNGAEFGLMNYDFRWHVGDRVTLLSDGHFDFFGQGLRTMSVGGILTRPELGSLYVGYRSIEGPISSNLLSASLSYRMSEKWIATAGSSIDFSSAGNIGQSLSFTRIGESFFVRLGIHSDVSRGNVGVVMSIEPRFLPRSRLGMVGGVQVPPAGARGLQ